MHLLFISDKSDKPFNTIWTIEHLKKKSEILTKDSLAKLPKYVIVIYGKHIPPPPPPPPKKKKSREERHADLFIIVLISGL